MVLDGALRNVRAGTGGSNPGDPGQTVITSPPRCQTRSVAGMRCNDQGPGRHRGPRTGRFRLAAPVTITAPGGRCSSPDADTPAYHDGHRGGPGQARSSAGNTNRVTSGSDPIPPCQPVTADGAADSARNAGELEATWGSYHDGRGESPEDTDRLIAPKQRRCHRLLVSLTAGSGLARLGLGARFVALSSAAHAWSCGSHLACEDRAPL